MKIETTPALSRASADASDQAALRAVAHEFEGLLMGEVMKAMRRTVPTPESSNSGQEIFTGMLDESLAGVVSSGSGLGLADLLEAQLRGALTSSPPSTSPEAARLLADGKWTSPLAGPRGPVSEAQSFGAFRPGKRPAVCGAGHCGLDIGRAAGTPVVAARDGIVTHVGRDAGSDTGLWVELAHDNGRMATRYLHLAAIDDRVEVGRSVGRGEPVGEVGATGRTAHGDHLHLEILDRTAGGRVQWVDPAQYLEAWSMKHLDSYGDSSKTPHELPQDSGLPVDGPGREGPAGTAR